VVLALDTLSFPLRLYWSISPTCLSRILKSLALVPVEVFRDHDSDHCPTVSIIPLVITLNPVPRIFWPYARQRRLRASSMKPIMLRNSKLSWKAFLTVFVRALEMSCGVVLDPVSDCSFSSIVLMTSHATQTRELRSDGCFPRLRQSMACSLGTSFVSCVILAGRSSMRRSLCLWYPVKCKARMFGDLACRVPFPIIRCSSNRECGREPRTESRALRHSTEQKGSRKRGGRSCGNRAG